MKQGMCLLRKKKNTRCTKIWILLLLFSIVHATASESEIAGPRRASADGTLNDLQRFSRATSGASSNGTSSEIASFRRAPADDTITNLQAISNMTSETTLHETPSESEIAARFRRASADDTISDLQKFSRATSEATSHGTSSASEIASSRRAPADDTLVNLQTSSNMTSETIPHETSSESKIAARFRRASADDTITNLQEVPNMTSETIPREKSSESEIAGRFRRASADDTIANLQRLSRIASGIALELGLSDNSLDSDDAVAELLRIGSLKLQNVLDLDMTSIDKALKTLESLPTPTADVKDVEDRLILLDEIRRTSGFMANFAKFPGRQEYQNGLALVEGLTTLDVSTLPALKTKVIALRIQLDAYRILPDELSEEQVTEVAAYSKTDLLKLNSMENDIKGLAPTVTALKAALKIKDHLNFLEILYDERKIRAQIPRLSWLKELDDIDGALKKVGTAQKDLQPAKPSFDTLQSLATSRNVKVHLTDKVTSGFLSVSSDLEHLVDDIEFSWIKERVGEDKASTENLHKAFEPYVDLAEKMKDVEKDWNRDLHESQFLRILEVFSKALSVPGDTTSLLGTMQKLQNIDMGRLDPGGDISLVNPIKLKIDEFNLKLSLMSNLEYSEGLKDLSPLKTILSTNAKIDKAAATKIVSELKAQPLFNSAIEILEKLETDLGALDATSISDVSKLAGKISKEFSQIDKYHGMVNTPTYIQSFTDLHAIGEKTAAVKEAVEALQKSRPAPDVISTAKSTINSILKSKSNVEKVKKSVAPLGSIGVQFQNTFNDYGKVTQALGNGVQGLLAIQNAFRVKSDVTPLLESVEVMVTASNGLVKEHQESLKKLNGLVKTFKEIENFQLALAKYQTVRRKRDADFKSFESIFDAAAKISDFKEDSKPIQDAMVALNQVTKDRFADAKAALDKLKTLDLEFSRFKIADAKDSLTSMDSFFVEYSKKLKTLPPAAPPPKSPSGKKGPPAASNAISATTESPSAIDVVLAFFQTTPGYVIIAFAAVGLLVGLVFLIRCLFCTKKPDNNDDDGPDSVVISGQTKTPTTTPGTQTPKPDEDADKKKKDKDGGPPPPPPPPPSSGATGSDSKEAPKEVSAKPSDSNESNAKGSASKDSMTGGGEQKEEEAPKKDPSDDKTQTNGTVSEAPDLTSTVSSSNQRESRALVRHAPKQREPSKGSKETPKKPKKRVATPMPKGTAVERPKWQVENLKTADEGAPKEQEDELEGTQCSYRHYPCFSLARNMINQFEDFASYSKTPLDWLITQCDIQKAWADTPQHEREDHKFERRCLLYICRQQHRFYLKGFQDTYMNCNFIELGYRIYMSQAPQNGDETVHDTGNARKLLATDYKHVAMVHQADIKLIIMLCGLREKNRKTCAEYYPTIVGHTLKYGRYEITLQKKLTMDQLPPMFIKDKEHFVLYKLFIQEKVTGQVKAVDLLTYSGWFHEETPREPEPALQMIQLADSYNKAHVLVHCVDGVGRTGTLVAIKQGILAAQAAQNRNLEVQQIIEQVRQRRFGAVRKPSEVTYIVLCVTKYMMNLYEIKYLRDYWYIWYYHQEVCKDSYNPLKVKEEEMFFVRDKRDRNALDDEKRQEYEPEEEGAKKEVNKVVEKPPKEKSMSKKSKKEKSKKSKE
ncbi:unnamed protein product [Caenorhabditis brenneri]